MDLPPDEPIEKAKDDKNSPAESAIPTTQGRPAAVVFLRNFPLKSGGGRCDPLDCVARTKCSAFQDGGITCRACRTSLGADQGEPSPVDRTVYKQRLLAGERLRCAIVRSTPDHDIQSFSCNVFANDAWTKFHRIERFFVHQQHLAVAILSSVRATRENPGLRPLPQFRPVP